MPGYPYAASELPAHAPAAYASAPPGPPGAPGPAGPGSRDYYHKRAYHYPEAGEPSAFAHASPSPTPSHEPDSQGSGERSSGDEQHRRKTYTRRPVHHAPPPRQDAAASPEEPYMREAFQLRQDMELTLASLQDAPPGERPNYALPLLSALAIHGSPRRRLTLQEIFRAIQGRFEWYAEHAGEKAWKVRRPPRVARGRNKG